MLLINVAAIDLYKRNVSCGNIYRIEIVDIHDGCRLNCCRSAATNDEALV